MPHINDQIDFTVTAYIVHDGKVLLVDHKELGTWLPVGGHVQLDEDTEQALDRKIREECGLPYEIVGTKPDIQADETKHLYAPEFMNIHRISDTHRHIGLVYFAKTDSTDAKLNSEDHNAIKWFSADDLEDPSLRILPDIKYYAQAALQKVK